MLRFSRAHQMTYSARSRKRSRYEKPLRPVSTSVPQEVLDVLDRRAFKNGTTVAHEARVALIHATGQFVC